MAGIDGCLSRLVAMAAARRLANADCLHLALDALERCERFGIGFDARVLGAGVGPRSGPRPDGPPAGPSGIAPRPGTGSGR